jgi:hypothetical protein
MGWLLAAALLADVAPGADGRPHRLPGPGECAAVLLVFVVPDCPIANGYAPEVARLHAAYAPRRVAVRVVYADPELSPADAARHAREYGLPAPALLDPALKLARRVGATVTPEAAVLSPAGELLYRGRIDDRHLAPGRKRAAPTHHDLRDALDAVLAGRPVSAPRTPAVGCPIAFPDRTQP